jgi:hypothetical protein
MIDNFIKSKILSVLMYMVFTLIISVITLSSTIIGGELIKANFILGCLAISISPILLFSTAFMFQRNVVLGLRQICAINQNVASNYSKALINAAKLTYSFTRLIPLIITWTAIFIAVAIIPSVIGKQIIAGPLFFEIIGSIAISSNIFLFFKMYNQIIEVNQQSKLDAKIN